jgi:hypothetical protein
MKILVMGSWLFQLDVATMARGHVSFLEGDATEEVDLIICVNFLSYNGYAWLLCYILCLSITHEL